MMEKVILKNQVYIMKALVEILHPNNDLLKYDLLDRISETEKLLKPNPDAKK